MCNRKRTVANPWTTVQLAIILCSAICFINTNVSAGHKRKGIGDLEQDWGYITVRPYAHLFWWLFYTTANVTHFSERPLIIWLQGGPGMPSTGYGNFMEIGPLDLDLKPRNHSWINHANVLFIDNPVGVGFSYIDENNMTTLATSTDDIGKDLIAFYETFVGKFKEFEDVPLYIFGESYGGKITVEFAHQLTQKIKEKKLKANLLGIGLGDAYISPIDYIMNYAPFGLNLGMIDKHGYNAINKCAKQIRTALSEERYEDAARLEATISKTILQETNGIDLYNIVAKCNKESLPEFLLSYDTCSFFMNNEVRETLKIIPENVVWNYTNDDVYKSLFEDTIKPINEKVESLLNDTDIKIIVYNGVFDYIVNTPGTVKWLNNLNWYGKKQWNKEKQRVLEIDTINEGYVKRVDNLIFYTVLRAGHSVPVDNPIAMDEILRREILNSTEIVPS